MPETTEKYLRLPQHPGKTYTATRQGTLSVEEGIDVLYGQPIGSESWEIRTLLFRQDHQWTWDKVQTWIKGHPQFTMVENLEEQFSDLLEVEVFRPGTWKGISYKNEDMDRVATNSQAMLPYFQGKLKLGHDENQPAFVQKAAVGIATKYYTQVKDGVKRVYADFRKVPQVLAKAIDQFYPQRSVEKYRWFRHPETKELIPDVIKAVAFLGHTPPEVKGMFDDYKVLYEDVEQDHGEIDRYEWPISQGLADDVLTQDLQHESDGEAPLDSDSQEELSMPEDEKILNEEQTTDASPNQAASVEEPKSDDRAIQQTVTVNVPDSQPPEGFTEEDLEKAREEAKQEAADEFAEKEAALKAELDKFKENHAALQAEKFEADVDHYLEDLHLPESFTKLGVKSFLMGLDREQTQQFAEDGPEISQFDHFKEILNEVQKLSEVTMETLSSEQAPEVSDRRRNQEQQRAELFKELRETHKDLPATEIMKLAAEEHPELFEEEEEESA